MFTTESRRHGVILGDVTEQIIGAAISVHREIGPGLLESAYQTCFAIEMTRCGIEFEKELQVPLVYKGTIIPNCYKIDFLVARQVVVELKTADRLAPVHTAQLMTYLRMTKCRVGLLFNFNVDVLISGIRRVVL